MPGKRTSKIKQARSFRWRADLKNSSAESKSAASYPTDSTRPASDSRTDSSSSTTAITGTAGDSLINNSSQVPAASSTNSHAIPLRGIARPSSARRLTVSVDRIEQLRDWGNLYLRAKLICGRVEHSQSPDSKLNEPGGVRSHRSSSMGQWYAEPQGTVGEPNSQPDHRLPRRSFQRPASPYVSGCNTLGRGSSAVSS